MQTQKLADRVREGLAGVPNAEEKTMFGRVVFMVNGKMCVTATDERTMCRVDPGLHDELAKKKGVEGVKMKGREYRGYLRIDEKVLKTSADLDAWLKLALDFNREARAARKRVTHPTKHA